MSAEIEMMKDMARKLQAAPMWSKESHLIALAAGFMDWAQSIEDRIHQLERSAENGKS